MAGVSDCYTSACGKTKTMGNFAKATFESIRMTNKYLDPTLWKDQPLQRTPYQVHTDFLSKASVAK